MSAPRSIASTLAYLRNRYTALLVSLLALFILTPLIGLFFERGRLAQTLLELFFSGLLLSAVYAVHRSTPLLLIACLLALPALAGRWAFEFFSNPLLLVVGTSLGLLFLVFVAVTILAQVLRASQVTTDTVNGAVCIYLLMGVGWAFLFSLIETLQSGSFQLPVLSAADEGDALSSPRQFSYFLYYSFVTLTTLGYGDIFPVTPPARSFAVLEAVVGQLYIAILIAHLVGLRITQLEQREV